MKPISNHSCLTDKTVDNAMKTELLFNLTSSSSISIAHQMGRFDYKALFKQVIKTRLSLFHNRTYLIIICLYFCSEQKLRKSGLKKRAKAEKV